MNPIQTMVRYKAWADAIFFAAIADIPEPAITAAQPIIFGSMIRTLNHSYAMDQVWRAHLEGKRHGLTTRNPESCPTFDELHKAQQKIDAWFVDHADSLPETLSDKIVNFTFIGGGEGSMTHSEILLHVVNHTTYHRGHVADMMYQISVFPPTTDLPVFLRTARESA